MINTHNKMLDELFESVKTKEDLINLAKNVPYLKVYLTAAVDDIHTIDLPTPKYNDYHRSMAGATLLNRPTTTIVESVFRSNMATANVKRKQFLALSEMLYEKEARILEAVLCKNLVSIYPVLSHELICEVLDECK